jgi:hypothetical protein
VWPVRISDVSELDPGPPVELADEQALREWLAQAAQEPARFYDLYMGRGLGLRFALGEEVAGGIMESESEHRWWWLHEGDPDAPELLVPGDGDEMPVAGSEQVGLERLVEVLVGYVRDAERPPGRWLDEQGRPEDAPDAPWEGPRPRASGRDTERLVREIEQRPRRAQPLPEVLALLRQTRDDDLRAWLYAYAHHEGADSVTRGDWWPERPQMRGRDVQIGILASGDPVVARRKGGVELISPDGWLRLDFEDFLSQLEMRDEEA